MSNKKLLNCLKKRDLLNSDKAGKFELITYGERFLCEGGVPDAIDFFERAEYAEGLVELKDHCISEGDYFLFSRLVRILGGSPSADEWMRLGDNALALSKLLFARSAYKKAESPEKVAQVESLIERQRTENAGDQDLLH